MSGLAIAALALSALVILWIAIAMMVEGHRARRRRNRSPIKPFDVPAEWTHLEQREFIAQIFTSRLFVALVATVLVVGCPWVALFVADADALFELWVDDSAWIWLPRWFYLSVAGGLVVSPIVAGLILRGYLCPECRARLVKWTSPTVAIPGGGSGRRVLLMCPSCQIVHRAPWHVSVTGRRS